MKQNQTRNRRPSEQIALLDKHIVLSPKGDSPISFVCVYEDTESREWAGEVFGRVSKLAGRQGVRPTWWRMSNLNSPGVLAAAVSTAMRADVIVVSVRAAEGLPLPFYAWSSTWSQHRFQTAGLLVALLGEPEQPGAKSGRIGDYLRVVARGARLDFLLELRDLAPETNGAMKGEIDGQSVENAQVVNGHTRGRLHPESAVRE